MGEPRRQRRLAVHGDAVLGLGAVGLSPQPIGKDEQQGGACRRAARRAALAAAPAETTEDKKCAHGTNATELEVMIRMLLTGQGSAKGRPSVSYVWFCNAAGLWLYGRLKLAISPCPASRSCRIWCRHSPSMGQPFRHGRWGAVSKRISR
jgi:hypothetical protein